MWDRVKRWFGADGRAPAASERSVEYDLQWHDPGDGNPFGIRFLDIRSLTWSVIATTGDPRIAESLIAQRQSNGCEFVAATIAGSETVSCDLTFPHNGAALDGIVFKSDAMEVKWDIYVYDSVFLFVRSWTGELQYRAFAEIADTVIRIHKIEASPEHVETAPKDVYFLLGTHAMGRVLPHTLPRDMPGDPQQIAVWSFGRFGNRACYATYEDVTHIGIAKPDAEL